MADAPTHTLYSVKNTEEGPRGLWSDGILTYVEPGAAVLAELTADDHTRAEKSGWFEIKKPTAAEKKAADAD